MKIVFLSRYQEILQRGAESFVTEITKKLSKKHTVDIFSGNNADQVSKVINGGYDIVIPINGRLQSLRISLSRFVGKYKILITGHSGIGMDDILNLLVKPDVFVALTDYQKKWAQKWAWGSKVLKIPNGIDLDKFNPNGPKINIDLPRPIILSVGALTWYKYHERAIEAVSKLSRGSLLLVGRGEKEKELEDLGQKKLGKRFKIMKASYNDMPRIYRSCDLFTLPSWGREAFGIVYLEAMASGLRIVAPDDPPRREIIGDAGMFVDVTNPAEYARAVGEALKIDWSKKARKQVEKFSWDDIVNKYEKVMLTLSS